MANSIFTKNIKPIWQAAVIFFAATAVQLLTYGVQSTEAVALNENMAWKTAGAFLLTFAIFNAVLSLSATHYNKYWNQSAICFLVLLVLQIAVAQFMTGKSIDESGSYKWIFIVICAAYILFMGIVGLMKRIVNFAEGEEWHHPKQRQKKEK